MHASDRARVERVLSPPRTNDGSVGRRSRRRKEEALPHAVTEVPVDVYREWEEISKPVGLPGGDTQMPVELEEVLEGVRKDVVVKTGLGRVKKKLEKSLLENSPGRRRVDTLPPPPVVEPTQDTTPPHGKTDLPGHLHEHLYQTVRSAELVANPPLSRDLLPNEYVVRNPHFWNLGTQDGKGKGYVLSTTSEWVWVRWEATGDGCYKREVLQPLTTPPTFHVNSPPPMSSVKLTPGQIEVMEQVGAQLSPRPSPPPPEPTRTAPKHLLDCGCHAVIIPSDVVHKPFKGHPKYEKDEEERREDVVDRIAGLLLSQKFSNKQ